MTSESGCGQTRYGIVFILAALSLTAWLIIRYTVGQGHATPADRT